MTDTTGNGWAVLEPDSPMLRTIVIPGTHRSITLSEDPGGFVLAYWALWYNDVVERLDTPGVNEPVDEGGYNHRPLTGGGGGWSEHAAGKAVDLNWARHPYNVPARHSLTRVQIDLIHRKMRRLNRLALGKCIEWGGDWPSWSGSTAKPDPMHYQVRGARMCKRLARILSITPRGRRVLAANPGMRKAIFA
jgi:hypothetical protein